MTKKSKENSPTHNMNKSNVNYEQNNLHSKKLKTYKIYTEKKTPKEKLQKIPTQYHRRKFLFDFSFQKQPLIKRGGKREWGCAGL